MFGASGAPLDGAAFEECIGVDISSDDHARVYAIGDIHGRYDLLCEAEQKIANDIGDGPPAVVVYLGDYIDRGPQSAAVLHHLLSTNAPNFRRICLRGNHDEVFRHFLQAPVGERGWLDMGGKQTLMSYGLGVDLLFDGKMRSEEISAVLNARVPKAHRDFLDAMPHWARFGHYLFVHAGVQPGVPLEEQDPGDLLWIREPFLSEGPQLPYTVVHGHTPGKAIVYGPNRIAIDTGAYATGRLTVLKVTEAGAEPL